MAVVLSHAITYSETPPTNILWFRLIYDFLSYGYLGVPLFFVISGFCIHLRWAKNYAENGKTELNFIEFWKRRIHRLYPPYLVMLCITMALVVVAYLAHKDVPLVTNYPQPRPVWMGIDFVAHLFMLHGLHPVLDKAGGNPPYWTLAREEYFYIMYLGLIALRWRFGLRISTLTVLVLGLVFPPLVGLWLSPKSDWWSIVNSSAIVLWIQWCLGMVAVEAYYGLIKLPRFCRSFSIVPVWAVFSQLSTLYFSWLTPFCQGMVFFTLINYCVFLENEKRWPDHWMLNWLAGVGIFSYSLYLIHNPVRAVMKQFMGPLASTSNPFLYMFAVLFITLAGYYAGKLFFSLVEIRFVNFRRYKNDASLPKVDGLEMQKEKVVS